MLKELFEASFYVTFPKKEDTILMLDERTAEGDFSLVDAKACQGCKYVCCENPDEGEQLKAHSDKQVSIVSLDQVFGYVQESVGEISDYLLEGPESAVVVEMTCSTTDYVKGKRVKARSQLYHTLMLLNSNPDVRNHLEKKNLRYVVFSWKETFPENQEMDSVEESMKGMILMSDEVYSPDNESKFDFGFKMKEIRYPDVLVCE